MHNSDALIKCAAWTGAPSLTRLHKMLVIAYSSCVSVMTSINTWWLLCKQTKYNEENSKWLLVFELVLQSSGSFLPKAVWQVP